MRCHRFRLVRMTTTIYTIGHSTRKLDELIDILHHYGITLLADVRTLPRSRHTPQFNAETLAHSLSAAGITYRHVPQLGGLRRASKDSVNTGWRNAGFRGYADHMQTSEFKAGLQTLIGLAGETQAAIMCAEALPWQCHRSMIGDALLLRGFAVVDIFDRSKATPERLTSFAKVDGTAITYPDPQRAIGADW